MAQATTFMDDDTTAESTPPSNAAGPQGHDELTIADVIAGLKGARRVGENIVRMERLPAQEARYAPFPAQLHPDLTAVLRAQGFTQLYTHQAAAIEHSLAGENVVVVTPTASGKTLCYNVPVLQRLIERPQARALYLFPTKALSHDQYHGLYEMAGALQRDFKVYTFDGDTPTAARKSIRAAGQIVVSNPDMLHSGVLPHHTKWIKLFENLDTVVIDELHQYRGVFGSHVANVLRRLRRICKFYGSNPRFICCSATVANPLEMAETLVGERFHEIKENGAPRGERIVIFYNPPVVNKELGIRASSVKESRRVALRFLERGLQTIIFAKSRIRVELLTKYLKRAMARLGKDANTISGYRGGYLPHERREIERGVKSGKIRGIVSTNALELGIDIGALQAAVLCGYPGTIASTWQQGGRAGRKQQTSVIVVVAGSAPLDQYLMQHPEFLLGASPEQGILNPDNIAILAGHIKCAVNEIPMREGETFGGASPAALLEYLAEQRIIRKSGPEGRALYHWSSESYPAEEVSLRTSTSQNFIVHNKSDNNRVLAEVDFDAAQELLHPQAIYMHQARTYFVDEMDWDRRKAWVRAVEADYYTDAITKSDLFVMHVDETEEFQGQGSRREGEGSRVEGQVSDCDSQMENPNDDAQVSISGPFSPLLSRNFGDVRVDITVPKFKKVKFETGESIGAGEIFLPQYELHTQAAWWTFRDDTKAWLEAQGLDLGGALKGLAWLVNNVAAFHVMSDPRDLRGLAMVKSTFDEKPALYVYDRMPGGVGLSRRAYGLDRQIFRAALELATACTCKEGCPSCVGPTIELGEQARKSAVTLLTAMLQA